MASVAAPRLRVALVAGCPFPWPRGTPARILGMAEALHVAGHDVRVVAYPIGDLERDLPFPVDRSPGLPFYRRTDPGADPIRLAWYLPTLAVRLARVVARHRVDVVHAHHYEGLLASLLASRLHRVPVIYDAHTTLAGELPYYRLGLPRRWIASVGSALDARLPKLADHTIATSDFIAGDLLQHGLAPDRVTVIGNGIEDALVSDLPVVPPDVDPADEEIVYAGSLAGYQGIDVLLEAFARVAGDRPRARLTLLTNSGFERFAPLARKLGLGERLRIEEAPPPGRLMARLVRAALLVNPRAECPGYPLKLLNYMASGRPIVSFSGSARGLSHGRDAWLVSEPSAQALARGMLEVLDAPDRGAQLGRCAHRRLVEERTWSRVVTSLEGIYRRVISSRDCSALQDRTSVAVGTRD